MDGVFGLGNLLEVTLDGIAVLGDIDLLVASAAGGIRLDLGIDHVLGDSDIVVGNRVLLVQAVVQLGSQGNVEDKFQFFLGVQVLGLLIGRGQWLTQYVQIVVLDVVEQGIREQFVDFVGRNPLGIHFFDDAHGNHARAEAGNIGFLTIGFQRFFDFFLIVGAG